MSKDEIIRYLTSTGYSRSQAEFKAEIISGLENDMRADIVSFQYLKKDGTIRNARGTLSDELVPPTNGSSERKSIGVFTYFDIDKQEWRCFKLGNIISRI